MKMLFLLPLLLPVAVNAQLVGDKQSGLASYYSAEYNGAQTAYGTVYDRNDLVAAHKAYPFNSTVSVRNEANGLTVVVRIIDKGPFIRGRIIELSERAARELGMLGERTVPVELTLLSTPDQQISLTPKPDPIGRTPAPAAATSELTPSASLPSLGEEKSEGIARPPVAPAPVARAPAVAVPDRASDTQARAGSPKYSQVKTFSPGLYAIKLIEPAAGRYGVQVGSFASIESAMDKVVELQAKYFDDILLLKLSRAKGSTYKVILGPFDEQKSAQRYASDLKGRYGIQGFTVNLEE